MKKKSIAVISTAILASNIVLPATVTATDQVELVDQVDVGSAKKNLESAVDSKILDSEEYTSESIETEDTQENSVTEDSKSSDSKEETLTEKTSDTESEELKEDTKKIVASQNAVTATVNVPTTFQTYIDPITKVGPTELTVSVAVSISQANLEGIAIEIPYDFTPSSDNHVFKNFTMTDPIFSLIEPDAPAAASIVESYEENKDENKLVIHLKKTTTTVETLNLRFKFNQDYSAKIPKDQIIWNNLKTIVKDIEGATLNESDAKSIKTSAVDGFSVNNNRSNPKTPNYVSGSIDVILNLYNRYNLYSLLDGTKNNRVFVEVPTGTIMSNGEVNYFNNQEFTNADDDTIPVGYTRYYRSLADDSNTFNSWNSQGNPNQNYRYAEPSFTLPTSISVGDTFHITYGMIYTKINGAEKLVEGVNNYTKVEQQDWDVFIGNKNHQNNAGNPVSVNLSLPSSTSNTLTTFGLSKFGYDWTFRNIGKRDVVNSDFVIYQKEIGSKKLNFNSFKVNGWTQTADVPQTYYRVKFIIKNALTNDTREVVSIPKTGVFDADLPSLGGNEYIDEIHVTPMGTDGSTEGHFTALNGIGVWYSAKNWPNNKWPDGTDIPMNQTSPVTMGATKYYDDETNNQPPKPTKIEQNTGAVYYTPGQSTEARAQFVSGNATDKKPGEIVNYAVKGYNENGALGNWANPEVVVAVPKVLEIQKPHEYKDFVDEKNNKTYTESVKVALVSSDDNYNYYKFNANNIGYRNNSYLSFSIPVTFRVKQGATVGSYPIAATTASHNDPLFVQRTRPTNNLPDDLATKMGYDNAVPNSYSGFDTGNSPLNVVYATKLNGETAGRKEASDSWSNITNFAVDKGGSPQMKASIQNSGNTNFSSVRLYNILPSSSDGRGSTGNVAFDGLQSVDGATVYYTTKPVSDLPSYETNLQDWDAAKLASYGFTTSKPADISDATAIFIDFGSKVVGPNSTLDTVMDFLIPNADNQKAINQFQYSAKEEGSGTTLNTKSDSIIFSTEVAQINFGENLPEYLAEGVEHASNMPDNQGELLDVDGKGSVTIPEDVPTLAGYEFVKWVDSEDESAEYHPGDNVDFTNNSPKTTIDMKAVWKAKPITIIFNENFSDKPNEVKKEYNFGDKVELSKIQEPKRKGYTFVGWSNSNVGTQVDFKDETRISFTSDKTIYAVWKANEYKISFDTNNGTGTMNDLSMTYDVEKSLPENSFAKEGYLFNGWSTKTSGTVEYKDQAAVKNLTDKINGNVTLYAIWKFDQTEIDVKDSTIYVGDTWNPEDNFVSAKDEDGKAVSFDKIQSAKVGDVDTSKIGDYKVDYSYNGKTVQATIRVVASQETLTVKDVTIYEGESWTIKDNFVSATDKDGKNVDFSKVQVTGAASVDTSKEGTYSVTYKYGEQEIIGKVIVLKNQTSIVAKDSTIYQGGSWNPEDNYVSATDKDGTKVDFSQVTGPANSAVDTNKVGDYEVIYSFNGREAKVTVHVVANQETLTIKDVTIYEGDSWKSEDNFVHATTKDGAVVAFKDIIVTNADKVDVNKIGEYTVTYVYGDQSMDGKVTVLKNQASILAKDSTIYQGSKWSPTDNFVSATDKTGAAVEFSQITPPAAGTVDTSKVGDYEIAYKYNGKETKVMVHVVANQETLTVKDVTIYEGEVWQATDNFVNATSKDGVVVAFKDIQVSGDSSVNTTKAGTYEVTYKYGEQEVIGKVIVLKNQTSIVARDSTIYQGGSWNPEDNFVRATDKTGQIVEFSQITAPSTDAVDPEKVGDYEIVYTYNGKETKAIVHVVKNQETLTVKNVTIYEGDGWKAQDNFVSATEKNGRQVDFSAVKVSDSELVDSTKIGMYEVVYEYGDQKVIGQVIVLENQTSIRVKDSTIYAGNKWNPEDNFVGATDKTGAAVGFDQITSPKATEVTTEKVGTYEVTYKYGKKEAKATIHVVKDQETLVVKDITIYEGDAWTVEDNFVNATTKDGKEVGFKDMKVLGSEHVDTTKAGTYELVFSQGSMKQVAKVIVLKDKSSITVKDTVIYVGEKWEEKDNFVSATDRYGKQLNLSDLTVTGEVDTSKVGSYDVTYSLETKEKISRAGGTEQKNKLDAVAQVKVVEKKESPKKKTGNDLSKNEENNTRSQSTLTGTHSSSNSYRTTTSANKIYPKTGEKSSIIPIISGASLISITGLIAWIRRKRKRG